MRKQVMLRKTHSLLERAKKIRAGQMADGLEEGEDIEFITVLDSFFQLHSDFHNQSLQGG